MERSPYGSSNSNRVSKLAFNTSSSPISAQRELNNQFRSPRSNRSFDLENLDPALISRYYHHHSPPLAGKVVLNPAGESPNYLQMIAHQYLRGNSSSPFGSSSHSPLLSVENMGGTPSPVSSPLFKGPVKGVEEGVLVMDGVLVTPGSGGRARSSSSSSGSPFSSGGINSFYKSCEDSSGSSSGSKNQFSHGKDETRALRFPSKNKSEVQTCKSYTGPGSCSYGAKCRFAHHQITPASPPTELALNPVAMRKHQTKDSKKYEISYYTSTDWCPMDDGIEVALPSASTNNAPGKKAVIAYIHGVLYGPSCRNRLPAFVGICSV